MKMEQVENPFDWIDFYKELAKNLLSYKNNREELISKVKQIITDTGIKPTLDKDKQIFDIDPFTVFGLFNKMKMPEPTRLKIVSSVKVVFKVAAPIPLSFSGIPTLHYKSAVFYPFIGERKEDDIENLWKLFESALDYVSSPTSDKLVSLSRCFDIAINIKYNGKSKITMGLFWINPDVYLNLDDLNVNYIYNSGNIPASVVENLPKINTKNSTYKISATEYFDIIEILRDYLQSDESELKTFYQLSWEAFKYSQKVKEKQKSEKTPEKKLTKHVDNGSEGKNVDNEETEKTSQKYSKKDFLEDVYMDEKDYDTLARLISKKKNVILQGAPGVGKTYVANRLAYSIMNVRDEKRVMMIQLHQNYSYEDFIMGFRPSDAGFELKYGPFYKFCKKAKDDSTKKYFFIIDEINRSNLSKILGELFMLIENDKRGSNFKLKLLYNDEDFYVPENVYIIGMMNTADRSLAMLDYALRRRFAFFEMKPGFNTDGFQKYCEALNSPNFNKLIQCVKKLNSVIAQDDSLGEGFCLGHSFFCNLKDVEYQDLSDIVEYELIPLLREYWFDEPGKVKDWSEKLRTEIK